LRFLAGPDGTYYLPGPKDELVADPTNIMASGTQDPLE